MWRPVDPARAATAWLVATAACAVGPDYVRPESPKAEAYVGGTKPSQTVAAAGASQAFVDANALVPDWWRLFRSRELDAVVAEALDGSPTLEAAEASLRRSEDLLRAGYGVFFPAVDGGASASRQRYSPARVGSALPASTFNLFSASANVSYALDVWGGQRRGVEALRAGAEAQRHALVGARLMVSGNVVTAVIAAAAHRAQLEATKQIVAVEDDQVRLGEAQAAAGTATYASVLAMKSQLASTRATLPALEQRAQQAEHLLATLTGHAPAEWAPPPVALAALALPADIPLSLPSQLVRQRPDILIAEAQLHAATAQIGVATAAMLPNITLSASYGANAGTIDGLGTPSSVFWSALASLTQPVFHGGALRYQRKAAIDARDQALAIYKQTVLAAFAQVADALRALGHDADTLVAASDAEIAAQESFHLVRVGYDSGIVGYLQVLTANTQLLQSRLAVLQAQAGRLQDTVSLFVALGGGWWNTRG